MLLMRFQTWLDFLKTKYFREVFKKYYKMSPSRYAKEGGNPSAELEDDEED